MEPEPCPHKDSEGLEQEWFFTTLGGFPWTKPGVRPVSAMLCSGHGEEESLWLLLPAPPSGTTRKTLSWLPP